MSDEDDDADRIFDLFQVPLRAVAHAVHSAIVLIDDDQNIAGVNSHALRLFGFSPNHDLRGAPLTSLIPQRHYDSHARMVRAFGESSETERSIQRPVRGLRADGTEFSAEASVLRVKLKVPEGNRRFYIAMLRSLSPERELKTELALLQLRLRTVLDLAPVAVGIIEGDRVAYANLTAVELFGLGHRSKLIGRSIYELLHPDAHAELRKQLGLAVAGRGEIPKIQSLIERPDGTVREIEIASSVLSDQGEKMVQMALIDITERQLARLALERSQTELRQLSASMVDAREGAQKHIARELHDELGQRLTALKMEVSSMRSPTPMTVSVDQVNSMLEMIDETVSAVRRIASDLRPLMLDDLGLKPAIEWLAQNVARRMDIEVTASLGSDCPELGARANIALYRMVQEALTNAARHAKATDVRIEIKRLPNELVLSVQDNGFGFPDDALKRTGKYGLMGIRERALMLGGRMELVNPLGGGGRISVYLPFAGDGPAMNFNRRKSDE